MGTFTLSQSGVLTAGVWGDATLGILNQPSGQYVGMVIDFTGVLTREGERSLLREPPVWSTLDLSLEATTPGDPIVNTQVVFSFVPEVAPADYTTALAPGTRSEVTLATVGSFPWVSGTRLGFTLMDLVTNSAGHNHLRGVMGDGRWSGKVALSMYVTWDSPAIFNLNLSHDTSTGAVVTSVESSFHSGQMTGEHRNSRIRHCPRSGLPAHADEFVRDGYTRGGLWVLPDWYDPVEPDPPEPPPGEGDILDEVS